MINIPTSQNGENILYDITFNKISSGGSNRIAVHTAAESRSKVASADLNVITVKHKSQDLETNFSENGRNKTAKTIIYEKSLGDKSHYVI